MPQRVRRAHRGIPPFRGAAHDCAGPPQSAGREGVQHLVDEGHDEVAVGAAHVLYIVQERGVGHLAQRRLRLEAKHPRGEALVVVLRQQQRTAVHQEELGLGVHRAGLWVHLEGGGGLAHVSGRGEGKAPSRDA